MFKKILVTLAAILALGATSAFAGGCNDHQTPQPTSLTQITLMAGSSVYSVGATGNRANFVTAGAYDASLATASQQGNTVKTFTSTDNIHMLSQFFGIKLTR